MVRRGRKSETGTQVHFQPNVDGFIEYVQYVHVKKISTTDHWTLTVLVIPVCQPEVSLETR